MSLFSKLFGKKKKKNHHAPATEPVACDECESEKCECVADDCEFGSCDECQSTCEDDD